MRLRLRIACATSIICVAFEPLEVRPAHEPFICHTPDIANNNGVSQIVAIVINSITSKKHLFRIKRLIRTEHAAAVRKRHALITA